MPACPGAMCERSMDLIGKWSMKIPKRSAEALLWEETQQETGPVNGRKGAVWR